MTTRPPDAGTSNPPTQAVRFDRFMDLALYGSDGFYANGRGAGTSRDFLTSPEVGSLFGAVFARRIDAEWDRLGRPDRMTVVEVGAGPGTLARTIFAARPACLPALHYVLVDIASGMRALHASHTEHLPPDRVQSIDSVASLKARLSRPFTGLVIANELLDNVPCRVLRFDATQQAWLDVCVIQDKDSGQLREHLVRTDPDADSLARQLVQNPLDGAEIPLQSGAADVLCDMADLLSHGSLVVIDYMRASTQEFSSLPRSSWMRTYDRHVRGHDPLVDPGHSDITVDVAIDQLTMAVGRPDAFRTQRVALDAWGMEAVLDNSARQWSERASDYDLNALRARSHVAEAVVLTDASGLGGFTVLEWSR